MDSSWPPLAAAAQGQPSRNQEMLGKSFIPNHIRQALQALSNYI